MTTTTKDARVKNTSSLATNVEAGWRDEKPLEGTHPEVVFREMGDRFIGVYLDASIQKIKDVKAEGGVRHSMKYTFRDSRAGELRTVWGSTDLDMKMVQVESGKEVRIEYVEDRKTAGGTMKVFDVRARDPK